MVSINTLMGTESFALSQVQSMLLSISNDHLVYTAVPILLCITGIHLIFRHFFSIAWFSVKLLISLLIYVHIRDCFYTFIGPDIFSIESSVFGVPSGTLQLTTSIGLQLVKARMMSTLLTVCPTCFNEVKKYPTPPPVKEEESPIPEESISSSSWVEWMYDFMDV
jgi:hypothetical protein